MNIFFKIMDYNKLWSLINRDKLNKSAAARIVGMSHQGFVSMMDRKTMTVEALEKLSSHFRLPVSYFFEDIDIDSLPILNDPKEEYRICKGCKDKEATIEAQKKTIETQDRYVMNLEEQLKEKRKTG